MVQGQDQEGAGRGQGAAGRGEDSVALWVGEGLSGPLLLL